MPHWLDQLLDVESTQVSVFFLNALHANLVCDQSWRAAILLCHGNVFKTLHSQPQNVLEELSNKEVAIKTGLVPVPLPTIYHQLVASSTNLALCKSIPTLLCLLQIEVCLFLDSFKICSPRITPRPLRADSLCLRLKGTIKAQPHISARNYKT